MVRRVLIAVVAAVLGMGSPVGAQDPNNPDELKKQLDSALEQLKAAQDRKNELAAENEKLQARVAELEKQVGEKNAEAAGFAERTWLLRAHYAAWQRFMERYPVLKARWEAFMSAGPVEQPIELPMGEAAGVG